MSPLFGPPCTCGHSFAEHDSPSDEWIGPCLALIVGEDGVPTKCMCSVYFPAQD